MAVLKSNRNESQLQFLDTARDLEIFTLRNCVKFPKRYTFFITTEIVRLSQSVFNNVKAANSIFPSDPQRIDLRIGHLLEARAALMALDVRLAKCYRIMNKNPEGCFTTSTGRTVDAREAAEKLEAMADNLGAKIDRENDLLKGQIESTSKRRKK